MNKVEIYIGANNQYRLDVGDFDISLNYSFNDIRDITKRNGSYSKTITIPGTKNNNYVLGGLFDVNADYTLFNPNFKIPGQIVVNSKTVLEGLFNLNSIDKDISVDAQGNNILYNVTIFSRSVDLLEEIGEKTLGELISLDQLNHNFEISRVVTSWFHTYEDGYVYPLYYPNDDPSATLYELKHFHPSLFYWYALDKILFEAGYGWEGSLKTNAQFQKEIIPYNGGVLDILSDAQLAERNVIIDRLNPGGLYIGECNVFSSPSNTIGGVVVIYDTETQDLDNQFNILSSIYTSNFNGTANVEINVNYSLIMNTIFNLSVDPADPYVLEVTFETKVTNPNTTVVKDVRTIVETFTPPLTLSSTGINVIPPGPSNINLKFDNLELDVGDVISTKLKAVKISGKKYRNAIGDARPVDLNIDFLPGSYFTVSYNKDVISQGDTVEMYKFFANIYQKDLITDLIKRYNLLIYTDPTNPNTLILDTYEDYYNKNTELLNWTNKKDYSKQDTIEFLPEIQPDTVLFTYTAETAEGDDNRIYTEVTDEVYGEFLLTIEDLTEAGNKEIKTPFSPTPLKETAFGAVVPALNRVNPKGRPRVLYYGGMKYTYGGQILAIGRQFGTPFIYDIYPYAGHFDDPFAPEVDLNFDTCRFYGYDKLTRITTNTQYNLYWRGYINQIENGRMVTSYFNLSEVDIEKVKDKFSYKIWIKDAYYYINRIIDYNPLKKGLTKVELLKINDLGFYSEDTSVNINDISTCPSDLYVTSQSINGQTVQFYASSSNATITELCCNSLGGNWDAATQTCFLRPGSARNIPVPTQVPIGNTPVTYKLGLGKNTLEGQYTELILGSEGEEAKIVYENKQFTVGNDNIVSGNNSLVVGDSNTANYRNAVLLNSNDTTVDAINVTALGTQGKTLSYPNSLYFGEVIRVDTITGKYYVNGEEVDVAHKINRRITVAELNELATNPIRLLPEVGTGKYPIIEDAAVYLGEGTVYDEDHTLEIYVDGAEHTYYEAENILVNGTPNGIYHLEYHLEKHPDKTPYTHTKLDGGIFIRSSVDLTGGDLEIVVTVHYRIVDINNV